MPAPGYSWIADPDIITGAIKLLVGAVLAIGGLLCTVFTALIGVIVYIWRKTDAKVDRIAVSLEELTLDTKVRIAQIETKCADNHANHRRETDPLEAA